MKRSHIIYVIKLIIDLIKIDKKIHGDEIAWLGNFARRYDITPAEMQEAHNLSLVSAVEALRRLPAAHRHECIALIEEVASIDNEIDLAERIILATIRLALQEETATRVQLISTTAPHFDSYDCQLIYLEQTPRPALCDSIEQTFDMLRQWLAHRGIDFFFFPHFVRRYATAGNLIPTAASTLFPSFTPPLEGAGNLLQECNTAQFCNFVHRRMGDKAPAFAFDAFYMIKIQDDFTGSEHATQFLCIEASSSPTSDMRLFVNSLTLAQPHTSIPYEGCYRTFFEMLSEQSKCDSPLTLIDECFYLPHIDNLRVEILGAERKTLYTLFLLHAATGITNEAFATISSLSPLGQEAITIYRYFAGEKLAQKMDDLIAAGLEPDVIVNLRDIAKRNSHIGFIKKAFTQIPGLKNPQRFFPVNQKGLFAYKVELPAASIGCKRYHNDAPATPLTIDFFK